ncbi:MAG: NADP-dependent oxidoreductase [Rhodanobacter sp.]
MSDSPVMSRRIVLASRPKGEPSAENFRLEQHEVAPPGEGQVLLRVLLLSLDPYMRGRMNDAKSYAEPVAIDAVMDGGTVAQVVTSKHDDFNTGDIVLAHAGWQTHAVVGRKQIQRRLQPDKIPVSTALGIYGMPGFTAWAGLEEIGKPQQGDVLVVAAASGPVGGTVGQIAKKRGARVIGVAGGARKCAFVRDELGFDVALDHHAEDFANQLKAACPDGIDVYWENVGGKVWEAVLPLLNNHARVPVCGLVAHYNDTKLPDGPNRAPALMASILTRSLTVRGFIQQEFAQRTPDFLREMGDWLRDGAIQYREDFVDGLEHAPAAFIGMLDGGNFGKLLVRVAEPD